MNEDDGSEVNENIMCFQRDGVDLKSIDDVNKK